MKGKSFIKTGNIFLLPANNVSISSMSHIADVAEMDNMKNRVANIILVDKSAGKLLPKLMMLEERGITVQPSSIPKKFQSYFSDHNFAVDFFRHQVFNPGILLLVGEKDNLKQLEKVVTTRLNGHMDQLFIKQDFRDGDWYQRVKEED